MILTEKHIIKKSSTLYDELDNLCFLSKNIYNAALYFLRQNFFNGNKNCSWININNEFVKNNNIDYYNLPCKVSQQTLKLVEQNMKSFFGLLKLKNGKAKLPKYLNKTKGRLCVTYTNQAISKKDLKNGFIKLSKCNFKIKTKVKNVQQVRVIPKNGYIVVEVLYKVECKKNNNREKSYCSIDLGLNNLMTCCFSDKKLKPIIFNGKPLKSINAYYNKHKAKAQSYISERKSSNRLIRLGLKRNNRIDDYLHKTSRMFVNYIVSKEITDVIVGYNKEWKQGINIGSVNNQKFVNIPYTKLINMLMYKCNLDGINVITNEESYTSKCSFLDEESIEKHDNYKGKRIKRGLFRSSTGRLINADVNGSYNILKKVVGEFEYDSILVCSTPLVVNPSLN